MQKSLCETCSLHKRVRNLGQVERYRMRDVHSPLISKEEWRGGKEPDLYARSRSCYSRRNYWRGNSLLTNIRYYYSRRTLMYECLHV